jgi:hypothetical protein
MNARVRASWGEIAGMLRVGRRISASRSVLGERLRERAARPGR